jgi:serine phosphatase RsbU (regulator of sigma subunit)/putative methionine-R-sulfoxide reductase with GAF domain
MSKRRNPSPPAWRQVVLLGEKLLQVSDLASQRGLILQVVGQLLKARAGLWLEERLFRLPGLNLTPLFADKPPAGLMRRALETSAVCLSKDSTRPEIACPIRNQDLTLGVLRLTRKPGEIFRKPEIDLLEGLAGHVALALVASHRFAVEQWRIEQLTLVRKVSAQIANVLDLEKLTDHVTRLIQRTFHYYYVSIFTVEQDEKGLCFRASAGALRRRGKRRRSPVLQVEPGQGLIGIAAETGQEIASNDVRMEPRYRYLDVLPDTRSEAVLPIKIEDQILGVLDVQSNLPEAFHPNDLLVLRALADTIAIAINNARLYGDLQKRAEHLAIVAEVSEDITSILLLDELLGKVATLIQERLGYPYVQLYTVHPNRRQIIYEAGKGTKDQALKGYVLDLDRAEGMIAWVARNGQPILANDVTREPRYRPSPFPPENTLSELTIPMIFNNQVVGVLDLQSDLANAFSGDDRFLLTALADSIAVAIHNADLYRTERWRRQVADSLREVAGLLSTDFGVDEVLDRVLHELERNLTSDVSAIWLLDGEQLSLAHVHGADSLDVEAAARRWPESYDYLIATLAASEPVVRKPDDPIGPSGLARGFSADYSSIAAALRAGDRPLGVLILSHHIPNRYGHEAQAITATFASYAAVAIENARLYDSAQEQAYASAALLQVAQAGANSNSLDEAIGTITRITPILVGVKACAVYLWEAEQFKPAGCFGFSDEARAVLWDRSFGPGDFCLLDKVRESSQSVVGLLAPASLEDWLDPELAGTEQETFFALQSGEHLLIGFPLMIKSDFYGVLLVEETADAIRFRQKRVEILNGIAQQVALSIQNEHLQQEMVSRERLEHEVELARQIQKTFLPDHLPEFPNWDLAAVWRTARQVGGDFYDVFELAGGRLGLFIADVSDKGIPAALFMAMTRTLVRAVVEDTLSPAEALRRVNELIIPDNQQSMFVTAVYGVLSRESGEFVYTNAGHNPPIWWCGRTGKLEILRRTGVALGVMEKAVMEERTIRLDAGDILLFYTDGLTEAFSPDGDIYGQERLYELVRSTKETALHGFLDGIEKSVDEFMGTAPAADDLTMLALKRSD